MVRRPARTFIAKFLYGLLFVILLPLFLCLWASRLDKSIDLIVPRCEAAAIVSIVLGSLSMARAMLDLLTWGKGLPMNVFPPKNFVTRGIYKWFSHPIYLGAALLSLGVSLWFRSPGGLYIITPVLILATFSLVYGYEHSAILRVFGDSARQYHPVFSIPASGKRRWLVISAIIFVLTAGYMSILFFLFNLRLTDNVLLYGLVNLAILFLAFSYKTIWNYMKGVSELVANSRHDWLLFKGRFRIINHGIYSGLAGTVGVGIFGYITGSDFAALTLILCALSGSAVFAQFQWGSASLLRLLGSDLRRNSGNSIGRDAI